MPALAMTVCLFYPHIDSTAVWETKRRFAHDIKRLFVSHTAVLILSKISAEF